MRPVESPRQIGGRQISIHAPLTGCDDVVSQQPDHRCDFNPRTPHGVRPCCSPHPPSVGEFQSTHPSRGATIVHKFGPARFSISIHAPLTGCDRAMSGKVHHYSISIHAPLTGCDDYMVNLVFETTDFNPRTPHGVRPYRLNVLCLFITISIHAPLTGCDIMRHS